MVDKTQGHTPGPWEPHYTFTATKKRLRIEGPEGIPFGEYRAVILRIATEAQIEA